MNIEATLTTYYAERAAEYENIYRKPERQADLGKIRDFIGITLAGKDVFEVACGTGYWTEVLSHSAATVVATDINDEVLTIAKRKSLGPRNVIFLKEDAYALPKLPQQFNAGLSTFWWSHIPKARIHEFLVGFHKILSAGSQIVFIDNIYVAGGSTPISRTDENGNTYQTRRLADGRTYEVLKNFPSELELRQATEGLAKNLRIELLQYFWILSYAVE